VKAQLRITTTPTTVGKLEANASGMWGWLAEECGLPIAEAIAEELIA
jgi:hypothetical protein